MRKYHNITVFIFCYQIESVILGTCLSNTETLGLYQDAEMGVRLQHLLIFYLIKCNISSHSSDCLRICESFRDATATLIPCSARLLHYKTFKYRIHLPASITYYSSDINVENVDSG